MWVKDPKSAGSGDTFKEGSPQVARGGMGKDVEERKPLETGV